MRLTIRTTGASLRPWEAASCPRGVRIAFVEPRGRAESSIPEPWPAGARSRTAGSAKSAQQRTPEIELSNFASSHDHHGDRGEVAVEYLVGALGELWEQRHRYPGATDVAEVHAGVKPQARVPRRLGLELPAGGHGGEVDDQRAHLTAYVEHGPVARVLMP